MAGELIQPIEIKGLKEFQRSLKSLAPDLRKVIKIAGDSAAQIVVDDARSSIPTATGKLRGSLRTSSDQRSSRVTLGKKNLGYGGWIEFGGIRRGGHGAIAKRPFIKSGRSVYPALGRNRDRVEETLFEALIRIAGQAGVDVS